MWPDRRILDLFRIEHPILLGPMASAVDDKLAIAVAQGGGLGAIPCAMLTAEQLREQLAKYRAATQAPVNVNFFCHTPPQLSNAREARWRERLKPYYEELGIDPAAPVPSSNRAPFDDAFCRAIEDLKPEIVSFHFGLPPAPLYSRVKRTGCPARGLVNRVMREIGPVSDMAPEFPLAGGALAPLRAKAESQGSADFSPMWSGEAAALGRAMPAAELTRTLAAEALAQFVRIGASAQPRGWAKAP